MDKHLPDIKLVELANKGEESAMNTLYFRYRDWVYGLAFRLCGDKEDAQEILQEVFIYFFNKFPGFELRSSLKTFLYPAIKNITISTIRKKRKVISLDDPAAQCIPDESLNWTEEFRNLSEYLKGFSKEDKELVCLRFYDELQLNEISEVFKVPVGTIKSRLNRLLARLREKVKKG
ncbi:MAG: sigma-70 family RNA polymerase sigma factor [Deltaproteobacteria bacterium]|nr:sigma-70 family RNA polymerase sigma factor [Deltaproteobacteria bacterium]